MSDSSPVRKFRVYGKPRRYRAGRRTQHDGFGSASEEENPVPDRSWLRPGQRAHFERHGEWQAGNVKVVYPEPPYSEFVKVRLDGGEDAYVPFWRIAEGMGVQESLPSGGS